MNKADKRRKIIHEAVKDQQTSHWDLDLLSREELEQLMGAAQPSGSDLAADSQATRETSSNNQA